MKYTYKVWVCVTFCLVHVLFGIWQLSLIAFSGAFGWAVAGLVTAAYEAALDDHRTITHSFKEALDFVSRPKDSDD
jgi:hypothetical protein